MRSFSDEEVIRLWEHGQQHDTVNRALWILVTAFPKRSRDELAEFPIGRRDKLLLRLREQMLGRSVQSYAECPQCNAQLTFSLDTAELRRRSRNQHSSKRPQELDENGYCVQFRLPNSFDLSAAVRCRESQAARAVLIERCVLRANDSTASVAVRALPEPVIERIAARISECDPLADTVVGLSCPACRWEWDILFDIGSLLWAEIAARAKRHLQDVHVLAGTYGWRENDILGMSPARRQFYLEMAG